MAFTRRLAYLGALLALLALAACGGGTTASQATQAPQATAAAVATAAPEATQAPAPTAAAEGTAAPEATGATAAGGNDLLADVKKRGKLLIATDANYKPQSFKNADGTWDGFDIAVGNEVAKRLGVEAEFQDISWDII